MKQAERCLAVVRHGCEAVFDTLRAEFAKGDAVHVIWDRRYRDRRREARPVTPELRRGDRRAGAVPSRWDTLGFLLVGRPDTTGP
jgi:hypothetical protein